MAKKILIAIFSILLTCALGFCVCWTVINFNKVKDGLAGTGLYTQEDIDNAYRDGYDTAVSDKDKLLVDIEALRNSISAKDNEISDLNTKLADYNEIKSERDELKKENADLQKELDDLKESMQVYKDFVEKIEAEGELVVTYEYDGVVLLVEKYSEGECLLGEITLPDTANKDNFLGWEIDGAEYSTEELKSYVVTKSITVIARFSEEYTVRFYQTVTGDIRDMQLISSQTVLRNGYCTVPTDISVITGYTVDTSMWYLLSSFKQISANDIETTRVTCNNDYYVVLKPVEIEVTFKRSGTSGGVYFYSYESSVDFSKSYKILTNDNGNRYVSYCFNLDDRLYFEDFFGGGVNYTYDEDRLFSYFEIDFYLDEPYSSSGFSYLRSGNLLETTDDFTYLMLYLIDCGEIDSDTTEFTVELCPLWRNS